jgi:hypothetical protein
MAPSFFEFPDALAEFEIELLAHAEHDPLRDRRAERLPIVPA